MSKKGFSLTELLAVVGVIGILGSLMLPSLNRAKSSADITRCMNNQRNIASIVGEHTSAEDSVPFLQMIDDDSFDDMHLDKTFGKYNVWRLTNWNCPSDNEEGKDEPTTPFTQYYGWLIFGKNFGKNLVYNYDFSSFVDESEVRRLVVSDKYDLFPWPSKWSMPYNSKGDRYDVLFGEKLLHDGKWVVQTYSDGVSRKISMKEFENEDRKE